MACIRAHCSTSTTSAIALSLLTKFLGADRVRAEPALTPVAAVATDAPARDAVALHVGLRDGEDDVAAVVAPAGPGPELGRVRLGRGLVAALGHQALGLLVGAL